MGNKIRPMQLAPVGSGAAARIRLALLLTATVLVVEVVGGLWAHSLALLSDAGHVVTDLVVLALSAFALRQVQRPATARRTFGYQRVGILVALVNALLLGAIVVGIIIEAVRRLQDPGEVRGGLMAAAAVVGLIISLLIARSLQPLQRDLTVKSALMHIWGDACPPAHRRPARHPGAGHPCRSPRGAGARVRNRAHHDSVRKPGLPAGGCLLRATGRASPYRRCP